MYSSDSSTYKSSVDDRISTANTKISALTTRFWNAYSSTSGSDLLYTELCSFVSSSLTFNYYCFFIKNENKNREIRSFSSFSAPQTYILFKKMFSLQYNEITGLSNVDTSDGLKTNIEALVPATSLPNGCS